MRILATADSHFGFSYGRTAEARRKSSEKMFQAFDRALDFAIKFDVDLFLHGGDMFNRSKPEKKIISKAYTLISKLTANGIPFIGIPGNHDRSSLPETLLSHFDKNLHFANKISRVKIDSLSIISFPFIARNPKQIFRNIARMALKTPEDPIIILCHQLFDGAVFGPHQHRFTNRPDTLDTNILPDNVKLVISGHIHRAQEIQNGKIIYTGSLERTSFMEIVEPKGFLLVDLEDDSMDLTFYHKETSLMNIIELDIRESKRISTLLDTEDIETNVKTMIRLVGRELSMNEIKFLWANYPAKDYPYLTFSPKKPKIKLKPLYNRIDIPFSFENIQRLYMPQN